MFTRIIHALLPSLCVKNAKWVRGSLVCSCGEILALRYRFDNNDRVFIYPPFRKYQQQILDIPFGSGEEVIGAVCFDDFSVFMRELKLTPMSTYPTEDEMSDEIQEENT